MPSRLSNEDYLAALKRKGMQVRPLEQYVNAATEIRHRCSCGYEFLICPNSLLSYRSSGCRKCSYNRTTPEEYAARLKPLKLVCEGGYKGSLQKTEHRCLVCEHVWMARPSKIQQDGKYACPSCNDRRPRRKTHEQYVAQIAERGYTFRVLGTFTHSNTKIDHECTLCGHVWAVKPYSILDYYGPRGAGCRVCYTSRLKEARLGRRVVTVKGYEAQALRWLTVTARVKPSEIVVDSEGTVPVIEYRFEGIRHKHHPDIWIPAKNILVEVKSPSSCGLRGEFFDTEPEYLWRILCAKARAARRAGYDYRLLLMDDVERISVPRDWYTLSHREIKQRLDL